MEELIPAYALGCLDDDEAERVTGHLRDCPACRAELERYRQVVDNLAYATLEAVPPADLRNRLLETIQPVPTELPSQLWWQPLMNLFRRPVPAWSLAGALALLLILGIWLIASTEPVTHPQASMQTIALLGGEAAPDAQGLLVIGSDGDEGGLVVEDLPALDVDHQYQLWLIDRDGQRTSGAVFSVDADGYGTTMVTSPLPLTSYVAFGVTIEPAGGSPGPTGQKVLGGTF
jgi:anti-sigma-K factor RskA